MTEIVPNVFQKRIYHEFTHTQNDIFIQAVAGSGKTTTLLQLVKRVPTWKDVILISFNRHITETLKSRIVNSANTTISTINSFGARMLYKTFGTIALVENKYFLIALKLFKSKWELKKENKWSYCYNVSKIVDVMRFNFCYDDDNLIYEACGEYGLTILADEIMHARQVFEIGMNNIKQIDFLDQVFMPVVRKVRFMKYDYVLADEAQDFSKLQHQFIRKLIKPNTGRLVCVGDRNQSIYHFAGATNNSFDQLKSMFPRAVELPLSVCYRCAKTIVEHAKKIVAQIESHPDAEPGLIDTVNKVSKIKEGDVVLCRMTKPLVYLCRDLISRGKKATIKGREIGENLIILIRKTRAENISDCLKKINDYEIDLRTKLIKKGVYLPDQHKQMLQLIEKKEIIKILAATYPTLKKLIKRIEEIFVEPEEGKAIDGIQLMTIHKSKGLEFNRVWFLNSFLIPSPYAFSEEELLQESNLNYVAITRAKRELIYINQNEEDEEDPFDF